MSARHTCQADMPSMYAKQICLAYVPGMCAWHVCLVYLNLVDNFLQSF